MPGEKANADEEESSDDGEELDRSEREAMLVAGEIWKIIGRNGAAPMTVMTKGAGGDLAPRPARFSDIVVLLRSMRFKADQFASVLRKSGIPVHVESRTGYFASMEVRNMMAAESPRQPPSGYTAGGCFAARWEIGRAGSKPRPNSPRLSGRCLVFRRRIPVQR